MIQDLKKDLRPLKMIRAVSPILVCRPLPVLLVFSFLYFPAEVFKPAVQVKQNKEHTCNGCIIIHHVTVEEG